MPAESVDPARPLGAVRVVELAIGVSDLGAGMATTVPGMLMLEQGADVVRIETRAPLEIDRPLHAGRVRNRGKRIVRLDLDGEADAARDLLARADVAFVMAAEETLAARALDYGSVSDGNPRLVYCHTTPSETLYAGVVPDYELLIQAASALMSQLPGNRPGPVFCDFPTASFGAALVATGGALAALVERERTGLGQKVETSLYDAQFALMGLVVYRAENLQVPGQGQAQAKADAALTPALAAANPSMLFECADGTWVHLHAGARGAAQRLTAVLVDADGDPPASLADVMGRWAEAIRRRDRESVLKELAAANVPVQPVLEPGYALRDEHMLATGMSVEHDDGVLAVGRVVRVEPASAHGVSATPRVAGDRPLEGLRVLDFGSWIAGPTANQVLADLGADVVKVEDPHTADFPLLALMRTFVWERGKRSIALDLKSPHARPVVDRLFRWADVVHHNLRPGVPERLGIDEASARAVNPSIVYCQSPSFGTTGPKAHVPGFDQTTQAYCGIEAACAGEGMPPVWIRWAPMDTGSGWLGAIGMLVGHYARLRDGRGRSCESSQMSAGLLGKSEVFWADGERVLGPEVDPMQTGYGPGYRIYRTSDASWLAVVVPGPEEWGRLRQLPGLSALPESCVPTRLHDPELARAAESVLEGAFLTRPGPVWLDMLQDARIPCAAVLEPDRDGFVGLYFDDPTNRELGRALSYPQGALGEVDVIGFPYRFSRSELRVARPNPDVGQHTEEVLHELGFAADEVAALVAQSTVFQGERG